jgi:hypothetical protein
MVQELFCAAALCFIITTFGSAQMSERIMNSACSGAPCTLNVVEVAAVVLALDPNPPLVRLAGERNLISRAHGLRKSAALLLNQSPHALTESCIFGELTRKWVGGWRESHYVEKKKSSPRRASPTSRCTLEKAAG